MLTNNFPGIGYTTLGRDFNFFQKVPVTATGFGSNSIDGYQPDALITFSTCAVTFQLEGTGVIQYSFNGQTTHGDMSSGLASANLVFQNRVISKIWFRLVSGSPIVRIEAWSIR
jgi:hypothetical protein